MEDWPILDHGILSPSGRVSRRAEKAAKERVRKELFGPGIPYPTVWDGLEYHTLVAGTRDGVR